MSRLRKLRQSSGFSARGFTLIELLVVLVVIAMLVSLVTPAALHARAGARRVQCANNLHEIGLVTHTYCNRGTGAFPTSHDTGNWCYRMAPGKKSPGDPWALPETYGLEAFFVKKHLMPKNSGVWVCPGAPQWMRNHGNTYAFSRAKILAKNLEHKGMARKWWVWDNTIFQPGESGWRGPFGPGYTIPSEDRAYPHVGWGGKGRNILFMDGHVEYKSHKKKVDDQLEEGDPIVGSTK